MKKAGQITYLDKYEDALVITSADIEGGHSLPFDCHSIAKQLQKIAKSVNSCCGDKDIPEKSSMRYCQKVIK